METNFIIMCSKILYVDEAHLSSKGKVRLLVERKPLRLKDLICIDEEDIKKSDVVIFRPSSRMKEAYPNHTQLLNPIVIKSRY